MKPKIKHIDNMKKVKINKSEIKKIKVSKDGRVLLKEKKEKKDSISATTPQKLDPYSESIRIELLPAEISEIVLTIEMRLAQLFQKNYVPHGSKVERIESNLTLLEKIRDTINKPCGADWVFANYSEKLKELKAKGISTNLDRNDTIYLNAVKQNKPFRIIIWKHVPKQKAIDYLRKQGFIFDDLEKMKAFAKDWQRTDPNRMLWQGYINEIPEKYKKYPFLYEKIPGAYYFLINYPNDNNIYFLDVGTFEKDHYSYADNFWDNADEITPTLGEILSDSDLIQTLKDPKLAKRRKEDLIDNFADFKSFYRLDGEEEEIASKVFDKIQKNNFNFTEEEFETLRLLISYIEEGWESF